MINEKTLKSLHQWPLLEQYTLSAFQLIALYLVLHKPIGDEDSIDPAFGPYISTLPREFESHPLTWAVERDEALEKVTEGRSEYRLLDHLPPSVQSALSKETRRFLEESEGVSQYMVSNFQLPGRSVA